MWCWIWLPGFVATRCLDVHKGYSPAGLLLGEGPSLVRNRCYTCFTEGSGGLPFLFFQSSGIICRASQLRGAGSFVRIPPRNALGPCCFGDGSLIHFCVSNSHAAILVIYSSLANFHFVGIFTLTCTKNRKIASF